jgi:hypothetical protein
VSKTRAAAARILAALKGLDLRGCPRADGPRRSGRSTRGSEHAADPRSFADAAGQRDRSGTSRALSFPRRARAMGNDAAQVPAKAAGRARILVVDDARLVRVMIAGILERAGFDVAQASDGASALESLARDAYGRGDHRPQDARRRRFRGARQREAHVPRCRSHHPHRNALPGRQLRRARAPALAPTTTCRSRPRTWTKWS